MHWIPNLNSRRSLIWCLMVCGLLSSATPVQSQLWAPPVLLGNVGASVGYAAAVGANGRLHILSQAPMAENSGLRLWSTDQAGVTITLCEIKPVLGDLVGLSLVWRHDLWHLAWSVEGTGIFHVSVSQQGAAGQPRLMLAIQQPMGAPHLVAGEEGLHLVWNSMCGGMHAVYLAQLTADGELEDPILRLSPHDLPARVTAVAYLGHTLYVSWLEQKDTWSEMVVLPLPWPDDDAPAVPQRLGTSMLHSPYGISLTPWPGQGMLLAWITGESARGQPRQAWPTVGIWQTGWQVGPTLIETTAGELSAVRAAVGAHEEAMVVWTGVENNRLVTGSVRFKANGEVGPVSRVVLDAREFFDPRPYLLPTGAAVLLSRRTAPATTGLYLVSQQGEGRLAWWHRWDLDPLAPGSDAAFKLLLGGMAGILASILALPALLLGLAVVALVERLKRGALPPYCSYLIVYGILVLCRGPNSWLYAQILPAQHLTFPFTTVISAALALLTVAILGWKEGEPLHLLAGGMLFCILDNWLRLLGLGLTL